ncbi:MAG: hypothetical protein JWN25_550, partial [Verrucomicrobiales bacterium]|nr:hypothetical protein [Verrucomicrobiales bacterium]
MYLEYHGRVNPRPKGSRSLIVILACLFLTLTAFADPKIIHLRNEQIAPPERSQNQPRVLSVESRVSGLFLIQFTNSVQSAWKETLATNHVKFLKYVPDNTFIVQVQDQDLSNLSRLPFVQWIGPYKAAHKIHAPLLNLPATNLTRIKILLSTNASPSEILALQRLLGAPDLKKSSRFGRVLEGNLMGRNLNAIAGSPAVLWMEGAGKPRLFDAIASKIVGGDDGDPTTPTYTQQLGFDGSGVKVAVADSGLNNGIAADMHPDLRGRVDTFLYYGSLTSAADEHSHGTHVAGIIAGNGATGERDELGYLYGLGVAPGAHIVVQRIFDGVGNFEAPDSYETLTHDAVRAGAVIGSNSWGDDTQGRYDISAAEFDGLVRDADAETPGDQQYILEFSAGNAGPDEQTVGSPAVGKNVIASGASDNDRPDFIIYADGIDAIADFSSRGPAEDGRIKPDVVAPGTWIASLQSASGDPENAWAVISGNYQYEGGTSQSGPHVSGAAAVFVQYYRETHSNATPSPALVKAALINSAVDMDNEFGTGFVPNNDEGWGRVDLSEIIGSDKKLEFVDQSVIMTNQQVFEKRVVVSSSSLPLKITMAYTDVPGFPGAIPALVNDLDLEVIAPDGKVYHGNQFENGESFPNPVGYDNINNVEAVNLSKPVPGEYIIRIHAKNVVEDARLDSSATDQDFALVISADIPLPGQGFLFFNKDHFKAPDTVQ